MKRVLVAASILANVVVVVGVLLVATGTSGLFRRFVHPVFSSAAISFFEAFPVAPGDVVFLGDSITAGARWNEMFPGVPTRNRGIGGDRTDDILARLAQVTAGKPARLFLKIGTNDLGHGLPENEILERYAEILDRIARDTPDTQLYVLSVLPRATEYDERVRSLNRGISGLAAERGLPYLDLFPSFVAADASIRDELTYDELHLSGAGYELWRELLEPSVRALPAALHSPATGVE